MITTSEVAVSVTVDDLTNLEPLSNELKKYGSVEVDKEQTIICVVGDFIKNDKGVALEVFRAMENVPIRMISYGGSNHNISMLINTADKTMALQKLNTLFQS